MDVGALQNVARFRKLLERETDPRQREAIAQLLQKEEAKLRRASNGDGGARP